jgi:hypothetical protein
MTGGAPDWTADKAEQGRARASEASKRQGDDEARRIWRGGVMSAAEESDDEDPSGHNNL